MKHLGKKPPTDCHVPEYCGATEQGNICACLTSHYRKSLIEAADLSEKDCINGVGDGHITCIKAKYIVLCNRCKLATLMRISAGVETK
jgi:hypothetical protein